MTLNFWGETTFDRFWAVPQELAKLEGDRYYLSYDRFREKDFLGMTGYYEIRFDSY